MNNKLMSLEEQKICRKYSCNKSRKAKLVEVTKLQDKRHEIIATLRKVIEAIKNDGDIKIGLCEQIEFVLCGTGGWCEENGVVRMYIDLLNEYYIQMYGEIPVRGSFWFGSFDVSVPTFKKLRINFLTSLIELYSK